MYGQILEKHKQVGNAVPPPMGRAIGIEILKAYAASVGHETTPSNEKTEDANEVKEDAKEGPKMFFISTIPVSESINVKIPCKDIFITCNSSV